MKILVVDELCYPQLGGIQVRFKGLAEEWVKMGHHVVVTAIDHIGTLPQQETINGVIYNRIIKDSGYYKTGPFGRKISTIIKYSFKLNPFFKADWDLIIFCQFPILPQIFYSFFYKKRAKTALDFVEYRHSKLWLIINRLIINHADQIICISEHVKNNALLHRKTNLNIIPSFVDLKKAEPKQKSNYIFLGRMEQHKHPEHAIEAVISYNKKYNKQIQLDVVGGGNMLEHLKAKYKEFNCVIFWGSVDEKKKAEILSNGRVIVLPSEREGLPIVVIEGMAYDIPTITTDYPGNGTQYFVIDEQIGIVSKPTIDGLTEAINKMENNYSTFTNRCKEIKNDFDVRIVSKKYLDVFN